jgi:hypothetical protein
MRGVPIARTPRCLLAHSVKEAWQFLADHHILFTCWNNLSCDVDLL